MSRAHEHEAVDHAVTAPGTWLRPRSTPSAHPCGCPRGSRGSTSTPSVTRAPFVGDRRTVEGVETTFVYAEARDLDVMVHLNGLTDGHRADIWAALLERVEDTDWYALTDLLPADGTWSYRIAARDSIPHDVSSERSG